MLVTTEFAPARLPDDDLRRLLEILFGDVEPTSEEAAA